MIVVGGLVGFEEFFKQKRKNERLMRDLHKIVLEAQVAFHAFVNVFYKLTLAGVTNQRSLRPQPWPLSFKKSPDI